LNATFSSTLFPSFLIISTVSSSSCLAWSWSSSSWSSVYGGTTTHTSPTSFPPSSPLHTSATTPPNLPTLPTNSSTSLSPIPPPDNLALVSPLPKFTTTALLTFPPSPTNGTTPVLFPSGFFPPPLIPSQTPSSNPGLPQDTESSESRPRLPGASEPSARVKTPRTVRSGGGEERREEEENVTE